MNKFVCAALAATMCMSVGLMANASSIDDYGYTVGRDSGNIEKYEENNGITDTGMTMSDSMDVQEFYFDNDDMPFPQGGPLNYSNGAIYGSENNDSTIPSGPVSTDSSDLDGWRPPSGSEGAIRDTDMLPGPIVVNDSGNFDLKWTPGYLTIDKQVPYPRNADATTSATETIIEDEDPMSTGTSELYAADGGIGFGTRYYNNTGLRHTNCNAHKYIMSNEEWQTILNKDDGISNDIIDTCHVEYNMITGMYRMFDGNDNLVMEFTEVAQLREYMHSKYEGTEYEHAMTPLFEGKFANTWDKMESASLDQVGIGVERMWVNTTAPSSASATITAHPDNYIYYQDGALWMHYGHSVFEIDRGEVYCIYGMLYKATATSNCGMTQLVKFNPTQTCDLCLGTIDPNEYSLIEVCQFNYYDDDDESTNVMLNIKPIDTEVPPHLG